MIVRSEGKTAVAREAQFLKHDAEIDETVGKSMETKLKQFSNARAGNVVS